MARAMALAALDRVRRMTDNPAIIALLISRLACWCRLRRCWCLSEA